MKDAMSILKEFDKVPEGYRRCDKCGEIKSVDEFYRFPVTYPTHPAIVNDCLYYIMGMPVAGGWDIESQTTTQCKKCSKPIEIEYLESKKREVIEWLKKNYPYIKDSEIEQIIDSSAISKEASRILERAKIRGMTPDEIAIMREKKLNTRMRSILYRSIKQNRIGTHWKKLVNYSLKDLKEHLELKFKPGMSWQNMGEWHIDHIIPLSWWKFERYSDREFKQCWALCNLQPLWETENCSKGNRYAG